MTEKNREVSWRSFAFSLSLLILLVVSALYMGIFVSQRQAIQVEMESRARALFNSIVLARKWNAGYGGVYVEKKSGVESNPYLDNPDIEASNGKTYTKKNPALMTREISALAEKEGEFRFRITSLKLLNPNNAPDAFEREALVAFENGIRERFARVETSDGVDFRYMAPLYVEETCLQCHANQGYKAGDVRGGISVRFNIDASEKILRQNLLWVMVMGLLTLASMFAIIYQLLHKLRLRLTQAEQRLREMLVSDPLTGLKNRRYLFDRLAQEFERARRYRQPLSCVMFDIDHFKQLNDRHGHDAGDLGLKAVSEAVSGKSRRIDIVCRYGGEEFIAILPNTDLNAARDVAEKLRQNVAGLQLALPGGQMIGMTASFGVSCWQPDHPEAVADSSALVKQADEALYRAKQAGRNRVETSGSS